MNNNTVSSATEDENVEEFNVSEENADNETSNDFLDFLHYIKRYKLLSQEEMRELIKKAQDGDKEAFDKMVYHNLGLVISIVSKNSLNAKHQQNMDLIQEGVCGLMKAILRFDLSRDVTFGTYAAWWIKQSVLRAIENYDNPIRVSVNSQLVLKEARKKAYTKATEEGRQMTYDDVVSAIEERVNSTATARDDEQRRVIAKKYIERIDLFNIVSFNSPIGEDGQSTLEDLLPDDSQSPVNIVEQNELKDNINRLFDLTLDDREKKVLYLRFGLNGGEEHTLDDIGADMGVTRERIRQIEVKAIRKLRQSPYRRLISDYHD